ncbi:MAG TPA: hypothetical protein VKE41_13035 [Roseiflexaceae bacterium]|nr:hypothetical protein [Roseiflexaceae bacterium]
MRKAIQLKVSLEISKHTAGAGGSDNTPQLVRDVLASGRWRHPRLQMSVKDIALDQSVAGDDRAHVVATVWVEGEDAPADDFAKLATQAMRDTFPAGHWRHPHTSIVVKSITEDSGDDNT